MTTSSTSAIASTTTTEALDRARALAGAWLDELGERPVRAAGDPAGLRGPLPERGAEPAEVVAALAEAAGPGLVASPGPRYFGFVTGGSLPAALAADWLTSAWDQNACLHSMSPAAATAEATVAGWVTELLGLPADAAVGLTSGAQMANVTGLAAARNAVFARVGWDVEARGLIGAPALRMLAGAEAHSTLFNALRLVGLGRDTVRLVEADDQGRMRAEALAAALAESSGPAIVCAQAGNVNSGAFDPFAPIAAACREHGAWLHIDGAFGLWAAAAPERAPLVAGAAEADSWAVDAHKWLNVPYDGAFVIVADPAPLRAAVSLVAPYLPVAPGQQRDNSDWSPEASRRARAFTAWAALRQLGREGMAALVEGHCRLAARMAARLGSSPGVEVLNDVVLNQVLVRFGDDDAATDAVVSAVQEEGTCWLGGTRWHDRAAMRISISGWPTREADVDRSADAILAAWRAVGG